MVRRAERDQSGAILAHARCGRESQRASKAGRRSHRLARANAGPSRRSRRRWTAMSKAPNQARVEAASLGHPDGGAQQLSADALQRDQGGQEGVDAPEAPARERLVLEQIGDGVKGLGPEHAVRQDRRRDMQDDHGLGRGVGGRRRQAKASGQHQASRRGRGDRPGRQAMVEGEVQEDRRGGQPPA